MRFLMCTIFSYFFTGDTKLPFDCHQNQLGFCMGNSQAKYGTSRHLTLQAVYIFTSGDLR